MRVVIVDDEHLALRRLEHLLARAEDVEVVARCHDGESALAAIADAKPDAVFLDVKMPMLDGFGVADAIAGEDGPAIVFVTAYDEFAVGAFETRALDYLLKPIEEERLGRSLSRLRDDLRRRKTDERIAELQTVLEDLRGARTAAGLAPRDAEFWIRERGRIVKLADAEIEWIEAERDYVRLHTDGRAHMLRNTMQNMEGRLDPSRFVRVHRSAIVNVAHVAAVRVTPTGGRVLQLTSGDEVRVGRSYESAVNALVTRRGRV